MPRLRILALTDTRITDAGTRTLAEVLKNLEAPALEKSLITDATLELLRSATGLKTLNVSGTQVTDAGLIHLKGHKQLNWLDLGRTQISDAGLGSLSGLTELRNLNLEGTQVTDAGVAALREALPKLKVRRGRP